MNPLAPIPSSDSWEIYDATLPFAGAVYGSAHARMAVIGLGAGELLVVSPGAPVSEARWAALEGWGRPRYLLAPNHFHHAGIATWKARYPEAVVVAHPRALPRLRRQVPGVVFEDLARLRAVLPDHVRLFSPEMARQGETWVSIRTSEGQAWFVTDGILNERQLPPGPLGWLLALLGFRVGLLTNPFFKRLFLRDKAAYKAWVLSELERDAPTLFVPAHGVPLQGADVAEQLKAVTDAA